MNVNLAKTLEALAPWELELDGAATIRPTIGQVIRLQNLRAAGNLQPLLEEIRQIFACPPDLSDWYMEKAVAAVGVYLTYFGEQASGNFQAIAAGVKAAMAPQPAKTPPTPASM